MKMLWLSLVVLSTSLAVAGECNCKIYPFKPNPPCYGECVQKLSQEQMPISGVQGIPSSLKGKVSSLAKRGDLSSHIDFATVKSESDLGRAIEAAEFSSRQEASLLRKPD